MKPRCARKVLLGVSAMLAVGLYAQETITYELKKSGNVSLAIYDRQGALVRTLLNAVPQKPGRHRLAWDGLDGRGKPLPAGSYRWKLLQSPGLKAEYLLSLGTDFGPQHWPGGHGGPTSVATDGKILYMSASGCEGAPQTVAVDLAKNEVLWTSHGFAAWSSGTDMCLAGDKLILPFSNRAAGQLHMIEAKTGKHLTSSRKAKAYTATIAGFDFRHGKGASRRGYKSVPLAVYSAQRGYGWESIAELTSGKSDAGDSVDAEYHMHQEKRAPKSSDRRIFRIDMADGTYKVRYQLGNRRDGMGKVCVGWANKKGKVKWQKTVTISPGTVSTVEVNGVKAQDGHLRLAFWNAFKGKTQVEWAIRSLEVMSAASRIDYAAGRMVVGYVGGPLEVRSPDGSTVKGSITVPDLRDVALAADGTPFAISGNSIVRVSGGRLQTVVRDLAAPRCLAIDRGRKEVLVVEGKGSHQIKRFDFSGKLLKTYGRAGGRRQGLYVPTDFASVFDIAADGKGGFAVVESWTAPRRTAYFDRDGKLVKEWYGGQLFFTGMAIEPRNENRVWFASHWGWVIEAEVDWEKRRWRPRATYRHQGLGQGLIPGSSNSRPFWRVMYHGDQKYLVHERPGIILKVDEDQGKLVPVVAVGINIDHYWSQQPGIIKDLLGGEKSKKNRSYVWVDRNADGEPQKEEFQFSSWGGWGPGWAIDKDFNYYMSYVGYGSDVKGYEIRVLKPQGWKNGVPLYPSLEKAASTIYPVPDHLRRAPGKRDKRGRPIGTEMVYHGDDGDLYQIHHGKGDGMNHGRRWPAKDIGSTAFTKWSRDGKLLWTVGHHHTGAKDGPRGTLWTPTKIVGEVYDCIGVADRIEQPLEVWTKDGLYVGNLFDRTGAGPEKCYHWWRVNPSDGDSSRNQAVLQYDMLVGGLLTKRKSGEVLFMGAGWNNVPVYRVTGWNEFQRHEGKLQLRRSAPALPADGTGLSGIYYVDNDPTLRRVDPCIWFGGSGPKGVVQKWPADKKLKKEFRAQWVGSITPRFTETYWFHVYVGRDKKAKKPEPVRLWIDGKLVLDAWNETSPWATRPVSKSVRLTAGKRVAIKLQYQRTGSGSLHLCWQSTSQPIAHVPKGNLFPK